MLVTDGEVCDGTQTLRFVGFSPVQKKKLDDFLAMKQPVFFQDCQIKKLIMDSSKLDIVLKGCTNICSSEKHFSVSPNHYKVVKPVEITLSGIEKTDIHTLVSVTVKVMMCEKPSTLGSKTKQNVVVSDHTDSITVQLWEEHIGSLEEGKSYSLQSFRIGEYDGVKYLALYREGSEIVAAKDVVEAVQPIVVGDSNIVEAQNCCCLQTRVF